MPISFGNVGLAEPSTITKVVASAILTRGSTAEHQEILVIGDPLSSLGLSRVVAAPPASTEFGQVVRIASGPSSGTDLVFRPLFSSTAADNPVSIPAGVLQANPPWSMTLDSIGSSAGTFGSVGDPVNVALRISVQGIGSSAGPLHIGTTAAENVVLITGNSTVAPLAGSTWNTRPLQSSAADLQMTATPAAGSTWRTQPGSTLWASSAGFHFDSSGALQASAILTAGNSSVTISAVAAGLKINIGSTAAENVVTITGNSTVAPLAGSTWNTRPIQSSAADLQMTATPAAGSTWATRPIQSSAADLHVTAVVQDGSSNNVESSTRAVGTNSTMRGLAVRSIMPALLTTASSNVFASTAFTIATSNAATIQYVYAYSIMTTNQTPTQISFYAGSTLVWPLVLAAISSAMSGANLAVSPPAYLFAGSTGAVMQLKTDGSTGLGYKAGVSYFVE